MSNRFYIVNRDAMHVIIDTEWTPGKRMVPFNDYARKGDAVKICNEANRLDKQGKNPADAIPKRTLEEVAKRGLSRAVIQIADFAVKRLNSVGRPRKTAPVTQPEPKPCPRPQVPTMPPPIARTVPVMPPPAPRPQVPVMPAPRPVAGPCPMPPAPKPAKAPRYQSKTPLDSNYHQRQRGTVENPVAIVRGFCEANQGLPRKQVVELCISAGVNRATAMAQYSLWKHKQQR